jgi:hypothetical protein
MKMNKISRTLVSVLFAVLLLAFPAACGQVSAQDIQGFLQAMEGKEMVITLDDGSVIRVRVEDNDLAAQAQQLVGQEVNVRVATNDNRARQVGRRSGGEDRTVSGVIQAINNDIWTIGGMNFKVTAATRLDGGLAVGVPARVEFITLTDGTLLAREIQTDLEDEKFTGIIQSITGNTWVIGGETFVTNNATRLDNGLAVGVVARVEFVTMADGTNRAVEIETDVDDDKFHGIIETMTGDTWVISGRSFKVNQATRLDNGLAVGVRVKVEFVTLTDGTMVATEIETDEGRRFNGTIQSITGNTWVISGQTFTVTADTRLRDQMAVGDRAKVRFFTDQAGANIATRIDEDRSGPSGDRNDDDNDNRGPGNNDDDRNDDNDNRGPSGNITDDPNDNRGRNEGNDDNNNEIGEDAEFSGIIESISANAFVIGGRTFKVDAATVLDNGLAVGVLARVQFVNQPDGTMLAREIETDN